MRKICIMLFSSCMLFVSHFSIAFEKPNTVINDDHWDGSNASLGLNINTGNTQVLDVNAGLYLNYTKNQWNDTTQLTAQFGKNNGVVNKAKYYVQSQLNYNFNHTFSNFIFVNGAWTKDQFTPYEYQLVLSTGYGRDLIKSQHFILSVQAGPGFRRYKDNDSKTQDNHYVMATITDIKWHITAAGILTQSIRYDFGRPYNYLKAITAYTNKIIGNLAVQISFTLEYYSRLPPHRTINAKKMDTTTNIAIVYNF